MDIPDKQEKRRLPDGTGGETEAGNDGVPISLLKNHVRMKDGELLENYAG
ncbi:hypothetical protein MY3296_002214 [Beauveria thailandica]